MLDFTLDKKSGIVHARPLGPLAAEDFNRLAAEVDPYIEEQGRLQGMVIEIRAFPGWEDYGSAVRHVQFVRQHHTKIKRIAIVTDSKIGRLAEQVASHFVAAEIRQFKMVRMDDARNWAAGA